MDTKLQARAEKLHNIIEQLINDPRMDGINDVFEGHKSSENQQIMAIMIGTSLGMSLRDVKVPMVLAVDLLAEEATNCRDLIIMTASVIITAKN